MLLHYFLLFLPWLLQTGLGEPPQGDGPHVGPCEWGGSPSHTWYLNGVKQEVAPHRDPPLLVQVPPGSPSVLTLKESGGENCSETSQRGEELLSVHFPPASRPPGLSVLLLLVVRGHSLSSLPLKDQDGHLALNSSRLLLLDTRSVEGNGTLTVWVSPREAGVSRASVTALGVLSSRVELPLLALVVGGGAAAGILLVNVVVCCLLLRRRREYAVRNQLTLSSSNNMKLNNSCLPRDHMSLPSNLQLNDLRPQARAGDTQEEVTVRCTTLADAGLERFPLVGYIYKASSMSSDEIWL